ncbi:hypothetical protein LR48_Vigan07g122000 [Vigna angularis]|uniref:Uncharacterized protein n=2 Tax=Phaseolus angularis TaxID=3914 RepID=A0A0L9UXT1_PHAAN|nr:hypothetical protein LR48_Vigan07g122000 [Vigna angularis]
MGESAKVEVLRTMSEIEQTKTMIRTTKIRLVAARKMKEAAEAFALVEINALSNNENESLPGNQITLSFKEYTVLTCKAHDAEEQSRKRVANAMLEVEETNLSNMNILKRVEEAKEEVKTSKKALLQ